MNVGVLSAGVILAAGNAAQADVWNSSGNFGLLNGNQAKLDVQAPIDVCGNAISLLGFASAGCQGGSWATLEGAGAAEDAWNTSGNFGILNGNQIKADVQAPINVCGNAVGILGGAQAGCKGGSWATIGGGNGGMDHGNGGYGYGGGDSEKGTAKKQKGHGGPVQGNAKKQKGHGGPVQGNAGGGDMWNTSGNFGIGNGNQASAAVQIPIDICGNAIAVLGFAQAGCQGGSWATMESGSTESVQEDTWNSGFNFGILNGNQANVLVQVPIDICGNAIAVLGGAQAGCQGGSWATAGGGSGSASQGNKAKHNRKSEALPLVGGLTQGLGGLPIVGSLLGGLGGGQGAAQAAPAADRGVSGKGSYGHEGPTGPMGGGCGGDVWNTSGNFGIGNGNQVKAVVQAPIDVSGNAVGVLGFAQAGSMGGAWATC